MGIKKNSYESFIQGAKRGVEIALDAFPYLLAMIFATKLPNSYSLLFTFPFKTSFIQSATQPIRYARASPSA